MKEKNILYEAKKMDISISKLISIRLKIIGCEITPLQARIINFITCSKKEICQKDIENEVKYNKSSISNIIDTMEKNNLIKKCVSKKDSRKNIIKLTNKSLEYSKKIKKEILKINKELTNNITNDEYNNFIKVIDKINNNINK